ncbi:unnamed protein product [Kuraishia capsulata CBS 1993]|uniref:Translocation protein SEC62 n=1 Tax=Kuraishia capsulata CBS 1993 TaxID=1382522 RepID=W6MN47_9ASCO|nr:uncharacterized protein KUCA_T00003652001 [Kuraishia capsulata CBS 1993]CDK27673.1 unnamed protein product [Kuraishia capsulata CBS 1993]
MEQKVQPQTAKDPQAIAAATFLREHTLLKQRLGINSSDGSTSDFFRYKRCIRALIGSDYTKAASSNKLLPPIDGDEAKAQQVFILLIKNQLIIPVKKLTSKEVREKGSKPIRGKPTLEPIQRAVLQPNEYYAWNFRIPNPFLALYAVLGVVAIFGVILFPLWPMFMRKGVWYLSTGLLCLIGLFFGLAVVRIILYGFTAIFMSRGFWIFPNLFEDVGIIDSFKPLYGWDEPKKGKKAKKPSSAGSADSDASPIEASPVASTTTQAKPAKTKANRRHEVTLESIE